MILWGVKFGGDMKIVSSMARADIVRRAAPKSKVFKLTMKESGDYTKEGPITIVDKDGNLYGSPDIRPYWTRYFFVVAMLVLTIIGCPIIRHWSALIAVLITSMALSCVGEEVEQVQREKLKMYEAFIREREDLLGT